MKVFKVEFHKYTDYHENTVALSEEHYNGYSAKHKPEEIKLPPGRVPLLVLEKDLPFLNRYGEGVRKFECVGDLWDFESICKS